MHQTKECCGIFVQRSPKEKAEQLVRDPSSVRTPLQAAAASRFADTWRGIPFSPGWAVPPAVLDANHFEQESDVGRHQELRITVTMHATGAPPRSAPA
jgi:hypothetical protein